MKKLTSMTNKYELDIAILTSRYLYISKMMQEAVKFFNFVYFNFVKKT